MLDDVLGEQAAFDVARAAGRKIDQQREPLSLIERLLRARRWIIAPLAAASNAARIPKECHCRLPTGHLICALVCDYLAPPLAT